MARVLKKTLQARARRAGIKGYSKMTVAQLQKAIASAAKRKPKRKAAPKRAAVKRSSTRRKPMGQKFPKGRNRTLLQPLPEFNSKKFIEDLYESISFDIIQDEISSVEEIEARIYDELNREVSLAADAMGIIYQLRFFEWGNMANEFGDPKDIYQVAYLALQDLINHEGTFYELEDLLLEQ